MTQPRNRREFLQLASLGAASAGIAACSGGSPGHTGPTIDRTRAEPNEEQVDPSGAGAFRSGVASGDPYADSVVLWTHFSPEQTGNVAVSWVLTTDPGLTQIVDQGTFITSADRDYTVKVVAGTGGDGTGVALSANTSYYYRFTAFGAQSVTGRTRTAPASVDNPAKLRFAMISCAMYNLGYFNAYAAIAKRRDLNGVFVLGDYIYEYGGDFDLGRSPNPERSMRPGNEIQSLEDYRIRHAWYKGDTDLQEMHRHNPVIAVWDDHESTNDSWRCGADNHTEGDEGIWEERRLFAAKAYWEWMPVREDFNPTNQTAFNGQTLYRRFSYGQLLDVFMLDTRSEGRAEQVSSYADSLSQARGIMSEEQERWLLEGLRDSTAQWKLIGQQTMISLLNTQPATPLREAQPWTHDAWDGYLWQRSRIVSFLAGNEVQDWRRHTGLNPPDGDWCDPNSGAVVGFLPSTHAAGATWSAQNTDPLSGLGAPVSNVVVITGDIHNAFGGEVTEDPFNNYIQGSVGSVAVELVCTSVTMVGAPQGTPWKLANPQLAYSSPGFHGYTVLDFNGQRCQGEWWMNPDINVPSDAEFIDGVYAAMDNRPYLDDQTTAAVTSDDPNAAVLAP